MDHSRDAVRGMLLSVDLDPEVRIEFQYNPGEVTDRRTVTYATLHAPGALAPVRQYTAGGDRTLSFEVTVDGVDAATAPGRGIARDDEDGGIGPELAKYRAFVHPATDRWQEAADRPHGFTELYGGEETVFRAPPRALFVFGGRVVECVVTEVSVTEQLFTSTLAPLRAKVQVSLVELSPYAAGPQPAGGA